MIEIINQAQSLFSDEKVKSLIEQYIDCDGEFWRFYRNTYVSEAGNGNEGTEMSFDMIPKAITKYILDNVIEFIEYCDDRQVKLIDDIRKIFAKEVEFAMMKIDRLPQNSDERKKYESERYLYKQNINLGQIGYGVHVVVVRELIIPLKQYIADNSSKAFPEMISNYKKVCQAHGISEKRVEESQENKEKTLVELQQELERLRKQEKRTTQQRDEAKLLKNAYQVELNKK